MATRVWGGGTGPVDGDWNTATNWTGDTVPANGDDVVFDTTDFTPCTVPNSSPLTLNSLTFNGYQTGGGYWGGSPPGTVLATFFDINPFNLYINETYGNGSYSGAIRCNISGGATFGTWQIPAAQMIPVYLRDNTGSLTPVTYDVTWTSLAPCASADDTLNPPALGFISDGTSGAAIYRFNYPEDRIVYFRTHNYAYSNLAGAYPGNIIFNKTGGNARIVSQKFDSDPSFASIFYCLTSYRLNMGLSPMSITVNCSTLTFDLRDVKSALNFYAQLGPFADFSGYATTTGDLITVNATTKIEITGLAGSELVGVVANNTYTSLTMNTPTVNVRNSANVFRLSDGNSYYAPGSSVNSSSVGGIISCSGTLNFYDQSVFSGGLGLIGNYFASTIMFTCLPSTNLNFYDDSICLAYIEPGNTGVVSLYGNSKYLTASTANYNPSVAPFFRIYWGDSYSVVDLNSSGSSF